MDQVHCRLEIPEVKGLPASEMSVGRHVLLSCEGDWNKSFDFAQAQIKAEENAKYLVHVLKSEARHSNAFDVDLTTYVAAEAQFPEMILTDGTNEISLGVQSFKTVSVLKKPEPGQEPQKPYGYVFPLQLQWPVIYVILGLTVIVLFLTGLVYQLRRAARYAKMIADLQQYDSLVSADLQFYKSLRMAEKLGYPMEEIEKAFRLYVLRTFDVPMFVLNHRQIIRFLKKRKPLFKNERQQIDKFLSEFDEVQKKPEMSTSEKLELVNKLYRFVDRTQSAKVAP